jgi:nitrite reductase/ring-hydroxylating ferredoxin subunit
MAKEAVAKVDDLEDGVFQVVEVAGRSVLLVKWQDSVFAVRNICPHQSQAFVGGQIRPWVYGKKVRAPCGAVLEEGDGPAWEMGVDMGKPVVQCPWHQWEFRLEDGRCATDPHFRVRAYSVAVEDDGTVYVDTGR